VSISLVTDLSAALQLAAALAALWQIRKSGRRLAWSVIAAALLVMAGVRLHTVFVVSRIPLRFMREHAVGEVLNLVVSALLLAGVWLVGGLFRQAREDAQTARRNERHARTILESAPVGMFTFDTNLVVTSANRALAKIVGIDRDRMLGLDLTTLPDERIARMLRDVLRGRRREESGHYRSILSGRELFGLLVAVPERDQDGTVTGGIGFVVDLTRLHASEDEVRRLADLVERSPEAISLTDLEGAIVYANPAMCRLTGYTAEELTGANRSILSSGATDPAVYEDMWSTLTAGRTWEGVFSNRRKDGSVYKVACLICPYGRESGEPSGYVVFGRDVTERKKLEERLRQAEKMETIGLLAGGIAHDFNNVLTTILTTAEAARTVGDRIDLDRALGVIHDAGSRAAVLTRQLLAFSRKQLIQPIDLDLNRAVESNLAMIRSLVGEKVAVELIEGRRLGTVHVDPNQLSQILVNLCANARDAMPEGGRITIETQNVVVNGEFVASHPWASPGRYVLLTISDTGRGMDQETLGHVFEPFFTTKPSGKGTGLGLASVYGIVKQHEGFIHAYSEPGRGTSFKIYLPVVDRRAVEVGSATVPEARGGTETLLLAEDDPDVREALASALEAVGYTVVAAEDGRAALAELERRGGGVDLVISDTVMPNLGGVELAHAVARKYPDLPFLLLSGYSKDSVLGEAVLPGNLHFLQKPFGVDVLMRTIRRVLETAAP